MPRKGPAPRRPVVPDAKFGDTKVSNVVNKVMLDGKKNIAEAIVYDAMDIAAKKTGSEPLAVLHEALEAVRPLVEVKSRRVGGATYQVPIEVRPVRQQSLAFRWIIDAARKRSGKSMDEKLAGELLDAYNRAGGAYRKREETYRMAEGNRAFANYRW